jgi:hypothetical protein
MRAAEVDLVKMIFTHHLAKVAVAVAEDLEDMAQPLLVYLVM